MTLKNWNDVLKAGDVVDTFQLGTGWELKRHNLRIPQDDIQAAFVPLYRLPDRDRTTDIQLQAAELYWKLYMDVQDFISSESYNYATSFCSNCPRRTDSGEECCKDNGVWEEINTYGDASSYDVALAPLMRLLMMFAGKDALEEARSKINNS